MADTKHHNIAGWQLNTDTGSITKDDIVTPLPVHALHILLYLLRRPGQVISRSELRENASSIESMSDRAINQSISQLRKAFTDDPRRPTIIKTHRRRGYSLIAEISAKGDPSDDVKGPRTAPERRLPGRINFRPHYRYYLYAALLSAAILVAFAMPWPGAEHRVDMATLPYSDDPTLVVLPFKDIDRYQIGIGLSCELINELSKVSGLTLIDQHTALSYPSDTKGQSLFRQLGARFYLRGQLHQSNDQITASLTLSDKQQAEPIWNKTISRPLAELAAVPAQLSGDIAAAIQPGKKRPIEHAELTAGPAYAEFLRGLMHFRNNDRQDIKTSTAYFNRALTIDKHFDRPRVYLSLAQIYQALGSFDHNLDSALLEAEKLLGKLSSRRRYAEVPFIHAYISLFRGEHQHALEKLHQALSLQPSYADAYVLIAWVLHYLDRPEAALANLARARKLDPRPSLLQLLVSAEIDMSEGSYGTAIDALEQALQIDEHHPRAQVLLIAALANTQQLDRAHTIAERFSRQWLPPGSVLELRSAFPFQTRASLAAILAGLRKAGLVV